MFLVWPPLCSRWNEAHSDLDGSSIVKTVGNGPGEAILKTHLRVGKARGLSMGLPNRELGPCVGIFMRGFVGAVLYGKDPH